MTRKEEILDELVTLREALNTITDVNSKKSIQETFDRWVFSKQFSNR